MIQQQAIEARIALIVGAEQYDRLFLGFECTELEGNVLFVDALDDECAAVVENRFGMHLSIVAADILKTTVDAVVVLPRVLN